MRLWLSIKKQAPLLCLHVIVELYSKANEEKDEQ